MVGGETLLITQSAQLTAFHRVYNKRIYTYIVILLLTIIVNVVQEHYKTCRPDSSNPLFSLYNLISSLYPRPNFMISENTSPPLPQVVYIQPGKNYGEPYKSVFLVTMP